MPERPLTPNEEKFCYLISTGTGNANAYKQATNAKTTDAAASVTANKWLKKAKIVEKINSLKKTETWNRDKELEEWRAEVRKIAYLDMHDIVEDTTNDGNCVLFKPWKEIDGHLIAEINEKRGKDGDSFLQVRPHDKTKALDMLGKHLAAFDNTIKVDLTDSAKTAFEAWEKHKAKG